MADVFPEVGQVVLTSLLSLAAMFIFTRAGGKRQIAQMSPFDYLNAVTVGSIGAELATNLKEFFSLNVSKAQLGIEQLFS